MRKEFVYSFMALGAIPVMVNAADVKTFDVQVVTDQGIDLSAGQLVPGKYTFTTAKIVKQFSEGVLTVSGIPGKDAMKFKDGEEIIIDFELKETTDVTINLKADYQVKFDVKDIKVVLNFTAEEFKAKVAELEKKYNEALAIVGSYEEKDKNAEILNALHEIGVEIEKIGTTETYENYVASELWKDPSESEALKKLDASIEQAKADAAANEIAYQGEQLDKALAPIEERYNKLSDAAKAKIDKLEVTVASVKKEIEDFKKGDSTDASALLTKINDELAKNVKAGEDFDGANGDAFKAVQDKVKEATAAFTAANEEIQNALPKDKDDSETLRAEGVKALTSQFDIINKVSDDSEAANEDGTIKDKKDDFISQLSDVITKLQEISDTYVKYAGILDDAHAIVDANQKQLDKNSEDKKDAIANDKDVAADQAAAQKLIDELSKKIADNANTENINKLADLSEDAKKIEEAVEKLLTGDNILNYEAYARVKAEYDNLLKTITDNYADYKKLSEKDATYDVANFWDGWFTNVTTKNNFPPVLKAINENYSKKKAVDYEKNTFPTAKADLQNYIDELAKKAPGAYNAYKDIKGKTDTYQKNLDDLTAKVKDLDIYENGTDAGVVAYKDQIAAIQKKIKAITDAIANAMKLKDAKHYDAITAITDDPSIQTDIDKLLANYEADQKAWEKEQADKAIAALQAAINALKDDVEILAKDIEDLDCGDNEADINKKKDDITSKVLPLPALDGKTQQELDDIVTGLKDAKEKLTELQKEAQAAADNQVAYAALNKLYATVEADLEQAKKDVVDKEKGDDTPNGAGDKYYKQEVLEKDYAKQLADLKTEIGKLNKKGAVDKQESLKKKLNDLDSNIKAVKTQAKENLDQKTKQDTEMAKAEKLWNEVFTEISKTDESSLLPELQEELSGYKQELTDIKNQIPEDYNKGLARTNGLLSKIQDIEKKINDVKAKSKEGYDERIAQDNADTKAAIDAAIKDARQAFTDAAETVEQYKGFQSDLLKNATEKVKSTTDPLVDQLYEQPDEISKLESEIGDAYTSTVTPTVFDKDGAWMKKVEDKIAEIEKYEKDYVDAIMDAVHADCDALIADYKTQRADAATVVKGFGFKDSEVNTALKDIDKLITDIETAITNKDLTELDKALAAAKDFDKKVSAVKEAKAHEVLNKDLTYVNNNQRYLDDADKKALEALKKDYSAKRTNSQLADNFNDLKDQIKALKDKIDAKIAEEQNYEGFMEDYADVQKAIDEAAEYLDGYLAGQSIIANELKAVQDRLDAEKESLENDKKNNEVTKNKATREAAIKSMLDDVKAAKGITLYDAEIATLEDFVNNELEAQYVLYANDFDTPGVQEQAAEYKKQIEALKDKIAKAKAVANKDKKPENLLPLEDEVTELLTEMTSKNNPQAVQTVLDKLNAAADALSSDIEQDPSNFTEEQQADIAAQQEAIDKAIEAVKQLIADKTDNILPFEEIINDKIAAVKADIDALQKAAEAYQKEYEDKVKAAEKLNAEIADTFEAIEKAIQDAKDEVADMGQDPEDFKAKFDLVEENLATLKDEIDAKNGVTEAKDLNNVKTLKSDTEDTLDDVLNTAAKRQLNAELENLQDQFDEIFINEADYTVGDYDKLTSQYDDIQKNIIDLEDDILSTKDYYGSLNGALGKDIEDIQKAIDELNKAIEDLKLIPEEPTPDPVVVPGNVDGGDDGVVDTADLDLFLEQLLNNELPAAGDPNFDVYDVNGDGKITIADAQGIANIAAGMTWDGKFADEAPARSNEQVAADFATVTEQLAGGITRIYFQLNSNTALTGFQMDVVGGRVVAEGAEGLNIRSTELANGAHRIISFGQTIENGMMLYVDVEGDAQFANVIFTTANAQSLTLSGTANAIAGIEAGAQEGTRYDLSGKIANGLKKGVNIIRDAYGNVKKVFVK